MKTHIRLLLLSVTAAVTVSVVNPLVAASRQQTLSGNAYFRSSLMLANPEKAPIYAAGLAGKRVVAVGDHGMIIFSDDGKVFLQAKVPTRAPLTATFFVDDKKGWAAGHDGTILATSDGGANWRIQRESRGKDEVLLSVWFENAQHGLAVGQFGLALETNDGGKTWDKRSLIDGEEGERHLMQLVPAQNGLLFVAAEAGTILRSDDAGKNWTAIQTDNKGSFWTGAALADGAVLMTGMRGHIYRSDDQGRNWSAVPSSTQQSLTGIVQHPAGSVRIVGLAGASLISKDGGTSFVSAARPDRVSMTAVVNGPAGDVAFTAAGVMLQ